MIGMGLLSNKARRQKPGTKMVPGFCAGLDKRKEMGGDIEIDHRPRLWTSMGMAASKLTPYQRASGSLAVSFMHSRV